MREDLLNRLRENHERLLKAIAEHPAALGAQLFCAAQQAEVEAYAEVFGESFLVIYKGFISGLGVQMDFIETVREQLRESPLNRIIEDFKATFVGILREISEWPVGEVISIGSEFQRIEGKLAMEFAGVKERRYQVVFSPVDEEGRFITDGTWSAIIGYEANRIIGFKELEAFEK